MSTPACRLYLITPSSLPDLEAFGRDLAEALEGGDVAALQIRLKDVADEEDAPYDKARRLMGPDRIVGVTCHDSRHLAMEAAEAGADYVAFGAFFDTATKEAPTRAEAEILGVWQETMQTPCVAIGGITAENARGLAQAGADFLAVSGGVWNAAEGPREAVRRLNAEIAAGLAAREAFG